MVSGNQKRRDRTERMKKEDAVLVVSFGTSYNDSRKKTIEEIEKTIAGHFQGYEFHRAFTSRVIINIL